MWVTIDIDSLQDRLTGPEFVALQTAALASGQTDPISESIERVTSEVRGYVGACANNLPLGEDGTIPGELLDAALSIIVHRVATRLPIKVMLTEAREKSKDDATRLLERVAACNFAIIPAEEIADEQPGVPRTSFSGREYRFRLQDGV